MKKRKTAWRVGLVHQKPKVDAFARKYGSKERVEWFKAQPCVWCGVVGYSENAHTSNEGKSRKGNHRTIASLCGIQPDRRNPWGPLVEGCHQAFDKREAPFDNERMRARVIAAAAEQAADWDSRSLASARLETENG